MTECLSLEQTHEDPEFKVIIEVFDEKTSRACDCNKKEEEQEDLKRFYIVKYGEDSDEFKNEKDDSKEEKNDKFEPVIEENGDIHIIDPIQKQGLKNIEKNIDIIEEPKPKEKEKNIIIPSKNRELDSSLNLHQKSIKDKAFIESKEELDKFKIKEKEGLVIIVGDQNNYPHELNNELETRDDNKFIEVKKTEHYIIDKEFKIFNPPNKKHQLRYLQKPIFRILGHKRHKRKSMSDLMRKKQKSYAFKDLLFILNSKLKDININFEFKLPQTMITNVAKKENGRFLEMTLKEIFIERYFDKDKEINDANIALEENNKQILELLEEENNENINDILHMNMSEIYAEFFKSAQFRKYINKLEKNDESYEYIYKYIQVAKKFVKFYSSKKSKTN